MSILTFFAILCPEKVNFPSVVFSVSQIVGDNDIVGADFRKADNGGMKNGNLADATNTQWACTPSLQSNVLKRWIFPSLMVSVSMIIDDNDMVDTNMHKSYVGDVQKMTIAYRYPK